MTINDPRDSPEYQVGGDKYKGAYETTQGGVAPKTVADFHKRSDVDSSQEAQHHTLGVKHDQASSGDHNHNGANSLKIMKGMTITGAKGGNAAVASIIAQLVKLGATDTSTP